MYENTSKVGDIGESIAVHEFIKRGIAVSLPFGSNVPYDMIIDINGRLYRVQCKTRTKKDDEHHITFYSCRTNGFTYKHKKYGENEVDYFFFYCMENGYKALVPISDVKGGEFIIRFSLPRNGQKVGIHMAADYALDVQLAKLCESENTVEE